MACLAPFEMRTVRQEIIEFLHGRMLTAKDISREVGIREKEVAAHLDHIARSLHGSGRFVREPSRCLNCGFIFKKRERMRTPGKCPKCRSEEITETRYGVKDG